MLYKDKPMETCKNCKYWKPIDIDFVNEKEYGSCAMVSELLHISDTNGIVIDIPETYENMGCVLHKAKKINV